MHIVQHSFYCCDANTKWEGYFEPCKTVRPAQVRMDLLPRYDQNTLGVASIFRVPPEAHPAQVSQLPDTCHNNAI